MASGLARPSRDVWDENASVSMSAADEQKKIADMYVKPGKIGGFARSREKSGVWTCFGELFYRDPDCSASGDVISVDGSRHYCLLCLENVKCLPECLRSISQIQSYSTATSTATMAEHMNTKHDIKIRSLMEDARGKRKSICFEEKPFGGPVNLMTLPSFSSTSASDNFNHDLLVWLAMDFEPLSVVNNKGLRYFFGKNVPYVHIPDETTLWRTHMIGIYESLANEVKSDLANVGSVCLMFHGWKDRCHGIYYVGLRAQFIQDDWKEKVVTLSIKPCAEDDNSIIEHLKTEIGSFIPHFAEKELFATHDGANAMIKVSEVLNAKNWNYGIEHALHQLLTTDSLHKITHVVSILRRCVRVVSMLYLKLDVLEHAVQRAHGQIVSTELLDMIVELTRLFEAGNCQVIEESGSLAFSGEPHNLELDSPGDFELVLGHGDMDASYCSSSSRGSPNNLPLNWNTSFEMIERLLRFRSEVAVALQMIEKADQCLNEHELGLLQELFAFWQNFRGLIELVNTPITLLSLIPLIRAELTDACKINSDDCKELKLMKKFIFENLDKRLPLSQSAKLATILDPATKGLLDISDDEKVDILHSAVSVNSNFIHIPECSNKIKIEDDVSADSGSSMTESTGPVSKKIKLILKHVSCAKTLPQSALREEIKKYLGYCPENYEDDPLAFWKSGQFPQLEELAKKVLTQSASAVPVEFMFSTSGILLNAKRSSLSPHRANCLSFIRDNYALYF